MPEWWGNPAQSIATRAEGAARCGYGVNTAARSVYFLTISWDKVCCVLQSSAFPCPRLEEFRPPQILVFFDIKKTPFPCVFLTWVPSKNSYHSFFFSSVLSMLLLSHPDEKTWELCQLNRLGIKLENLFLLFICLYLFLISEQLRTSHLSTLNVSSVLHFLWV